MAKGLLLIAAAALASSADAHALAAGRRPLVASRAGLARRAPAPRPGAEPTKALAADMTARIIQGATQGAVGAVVAATLSAFTEPVVNRILVQRISVVDSIKQLDMAKSRKFFMTTLPTNFLKFPLFEAVRAPRACAGRRSPRFAASAARRRLRAGVLLHGCCRGGGEGLCPLCERSVSPAARCGARLTPGGSSRARARSGNPAVPNLDATPCSLFPLRTRAFRLPFQRSTS